MTLPFDFRIVTAPNNGRTSTGAPQVASVITSQVVARAAQQAEE